MKTLGLVGGTGWISTVEYYRYINEEVGRRLGGLNAARCILYSINYAEIDQFNQRGDRAGVFNLVLKAAHVLEQGGADGILLCANTLHGFAADLQPRISRPILHIADATADEIRGRGLTCVGLLGTRPTMEGGFIRDRLAAAGIHAEVPEAPDRAFIHESIRTELLRGRFLPETRDRFLEIISGLARRGAEGIVLGCTEIPLLITPAHAPLPIIDTLAVHARAAVDFALGDSMPAPRTA